MAARSHPSCTGLQLPGFEAAFLFWFSVAMCWWWCGPYCGSTYTGARSPVHIPDFLYGNQQLPQYKEAEGLLPLYCGIEGKLLDICTYIHQYIYVYGAHIIP